MNPSHSWGALLGVWLLGACTVVAQSPSTEFYALSALDEQMAPPKGANRDISIAVGPVELPEILDRPQIVTRSGRNELEIAEFHRWGGSIRDEFTRVLGENLSILLGTDQVATYPWRNTTVFDYQVTVNVTRFDATLGQTARLTARWMVFGARQGRVLLSRKSRLSEPADGLTHGAAVAAMNQTLDNFSQEIAAAIRGIVAKHDEH